MVCRGVLAVALLAVVAAARVAVGDESAGRAPDEQAIIATSEQYIAALGRGDAKALAEFWLPQADVIDETGRLFPAQELIDEAAKADRGAPKPHVKLTIRSIRFLTADVAIEDGASEVTPAGANATPAYGRFTAVWVKHDGKWRLASLREARGEPPAGNSTLADLDGMTGEWVAENEDEKIEVSTHWNSAHTLLMRGLKMFKAGKVVFSGLQRIGWDPADQKIKSTMFDSEGGRSDGIWTRRGDTWTIESTGVSANGKRTASTNTYTVDGPDRMTWKSMTVAKEGAPPVTLEIKLVRKPAAK